VKATESEVGNDVKEIILKMETSDMPNNILRDMSSGMSSSISSEKRIQMPVQGHAIVENTGFKGTLLPMESDDIEQEEKIYVKYKRKYQRKYTELHSGKKIHEQNHTGQKPFKLMFPWVFKCATCDTKFSEKSKMRFTK